MGKVTKIAKSVHFDAQPSSDDEQNHHETVTAIMAIAKSYIEIGVTEYNLNDQTNITAKIQTYLSQYLRRYNEVIVTDYIEEVVDNVCILTANSNNKLKIIDYLYHLIETKIESSLYQERIALLGLPEDIFNEIAIKDSLFAKCKLTLSKGNFLTNEALQLRILLEIDDQINLILSKTEKQKVADISKECHHYFAYLANNLQSQVNKDKYKFMPKLMATLDQVNATYGEKLQAFKDLFIANSTIITKSPDSTTMKFLKTIAHLLTLGIVAKINKGTFKFYESSGIGFYKKAAAILPLPTLPLSKVKSKL